MTARPSASTSTGTGHPDSRARTLTPSRRSRHTSASARKTTVTCVRPACTARSPPSDTPAATRRSPASCAATASAPPAEPAGRGSPSHPRHRGSTIPGRSRSASPRSGARRSPLTCRVSPPPATSQPASSRPAFRPGSPPRAAACDDLAGAGQPQPADIRHLAALTGISETALWHALPALAGTHDSGRRPVRAALACRRCAARAAHHGPVPVHLPAHQRACARHRTWLGRAIQIDITAAPEIIRACQRASRLARQHGITSLVLAEAAARQQGVATTGSPHAHRRAAVLASSSPGLDLEHPDMTEAAAYPETIKIAAAILSDYGGAPAGPG